MNRHAVVRHAAALAAAAGLLAGGAVNAQVSPVLEAPEAAPATVAASVDAPPAKASANAAVPSDPAASASDQADLMDAPPAAGANAAPRSNKDPFESWNRAVFSFNDALDNAVLKPTARAYKKVVPEYVRTLISNAFGNVADAWSTVNHLLQGKFESGLQMGFRVATNSVLGFGGLLDIGTEIGLEKQPEDFGQTLGRWGLNSGPYLVLPVLGPSTLRDTAALPVDMRASATSLIDADRAKLLGITLLQIVNTRAELLDASRMLDDVALDRYSFLRDAYLTRRQSQVYDGSPPDSADDEDEDSAGSSAK